MAFAIEGSYQVLGIVDQTHLPTVFTDSVCSTSYELRSNTLTQVLSSLQITKAVLGHTHEVKMRSSDGSGRDKEYVAALL